MRSPFSTVVLVLDQPGDPNSEWTFFLTETDGTIAVDPRGTWATPGAALDAAVKWCADRGLMVTINGEAFTVWRLDKENDHA